MNSTSILREFFHALGITKGLKLMTREPWIEYRADILAESEPSHVEDCLRTELRHYRVEEDSIVIHPPVIDITLAGNPVRYMATGRRYAGEMG